MPDLWRRLPRLRPLRRPTGPNWRPRIAAVLRSLADQLAELPENRWAERTLSPSMRNGSVADVAADLVERVTSSPLRRALPSGAPTFGDAGLVEQLRVAADRVESGRGHHGIGELTAVVQRCYDITVPLELPDPVPAEASQAVARGRVTLASAERRALLRGRSLVAEDAGWTLGSGPEIRGSAAVLVSWLSGRPVVPVFPPRGGRQA
jgi:hypothetical protein